MAYVAGVTNSPDFPGVHLGPGLTGGAFVTTNGGTTWTANDSGLTHNQVTALAVDPVAATTVYAGTPGDGVFKSVNGGGSWTAMSNGLPSLPFGINALAVRGGTVYAAVGGQIYWIGDGGSNWNPSVMLPGGGPIAAIVVDPNAPQTVYAGKRGGQVQKSSDGGQNFTTATTIPPPYGPPNCSAAIRSLIIDPQNSLALYMGTAGCGIFKSSNGAQSWTAVNNGFGNFFDQAGLYFGGGLGSLPLAIDTTTHPSTVYAGVLWNIYKTSDGGFSWSPTPTNFGIGGVGAAITLALDTSTSTSPSHPPIIYVGLRATGARKSTDGGATWSDISTGLDRDVQAMVLNPSTPAMLYAGTVMRNKGFVVKLNPNWTALSYSTFFADNGNDLLTGLAVDSSGYAYVSGGTTSTNFPTSGGAFQTFNHASGRTAFVTKLDSNGSGPLYSTYVGGSGGDIGFGLAVDASGNAYVGGSTESTDFPTVNPLFPTPSPSTCGVAPLTRECDHGIVFELNHAGTALVSSTYFGGSKDDNGNDLAMDATPSVSITGVTNSTDFIILNASQPNYGGGNGDAFVTKIDFSNSTQTAVGTNVPVQPSDSATGTRPAVVTFSNVTAAGNTTLGTSSNSPTPALPATFQLGNPPTFYNISSSATFTGSVHICISYAGVNYTDPSLLHLFHYTGGSWVDVIPATLDTTAQTICGDVTSFSPFAILQRTTSPPTANAGTPRTVGCAGPTGASVTLNGSASTDPNGQTLAYAWSGPFGTATGVSPTVLLPLGASTVTLVVSDPFLSSPPVTVSITIAVGVQGLGSPLAALVPSGQQVPFPDNAFQLGRTLPLKVDLVCGSTPLAGSNVTPPRIVALVRNGDALNLQTIDPPDEPQEDSNWIFRSAGNDWVYNLRTKDLSSGTYTITIQMPDGSKYDAGFVLR
jgi:Beta-propeller repeat